MLYEEISTYIRRRRIELKGKTYFFSNNNIPQINKAVDKTKYLITSIESLNGNGHLRDEGDFEKVIEH